MTTYERIVKVFNTYPKAGFPRFDVNVPEYYDRRATMTLFEEVAASGWPASCTFRRGPPNRSRAPSGWRE